MNDKRETIAIVSDILADETLFLVTMATKSSDSTNNVF